MNDETNQPKQDLEPSQDTRGGGLLGDPIFGSNGPAKNPQFITGGDGSDAIYGDDGGD